MEIGSILITGSSRGIGLEFVRQLAEVKPSPKFIFATCRNPDGAEKLKQIAQKHGNVKILKLEVGNEETYETTFQQISEDLGDQGLNILLNNAGIKLPNNRFHDVTSETMQKVFAVNCIGPLMVTKAFYPLLKKAAAASKNEGLSCSRAAVLNITSGLGLISDNTSGDYYSYRESKAALDMVTKSMSINLKPDGILAACLLPGWVATDMGGSNARMTPEQCVSKLLSVMAKLSENETGKVIKYSGEDAGY